MSSFNFPSIHISISTSGSLSARTLGGTERETPAPITRTAWKHIRQQQRETDGKIRHTTYASSGAEASKQPRERQNSVCKHNASARRSSDRCRRRARRRSQAESFLVVTSPRLPRPGSGALGREAAPRPARRCPAAHHQPPHSPRPQGCAGSPRHPGTGASSGITVLPDPVTPDTTSQLFVAHPTGAAPRPPPEPPPLAKAALPVTLPASRLRGAETSSGAAGGEPAPQPAPLTRGSRGSAAHPTAGGGASSPSPRSPLTARPGPAAWRGYAPPQRSPRPDGGGERRRAAGEGSSGGAGGAGWGGSGGGGSRGRGVLAQPPPPMFVIVVSRFRRECMPGRGRPGGGTAGRKRRPWWRRGGPGEAEVAPSRSPRETPATVEVRGGGGMKGRMWPAAVNGRGGPVPRPSRLGATRPPRPYPSTGNEVGSSSPAHLTNVKFIPPPAGEGGSGCTRRPGRAPLAAASLPGYWGRTGPRGGSQPQRSL